MQRFVRYSVVVEHVTMSLNTFVSYVKRVIETGEEGRRNL